MKYFNLEPRKTLSELYYRKEEVENAVKLINRGVWVALTGPKLVGKTSVAHAIGCLQPDSFVSYVNLQKAVGMRVVADRIVKANLDRASGASGDFLQKNIESFSVDEHGTIVDGELKSSVKSMEVLENIFTILSDGRKKTTMILDEAQDVGGGVNHFLTLLARIKNASRKINFVFVGTETNLMKLILSPEKSDLLGRTPVRINITAWDQKTAKDFLSTGLDKCGAKYSAEEIDEVITDIGTLPGWLNFYGVRRYTKSHEQSLIEAREEALTFATVHLKQVLAGRGAWVRQALRLMGEYSSNRWTDLENAGAPVAGLNGLLKRLQAEFIVTIKQRRYTISDPIYRKAVASL